MLIIVEVSAVVSSSVEVLVAESVSFPSSIVLFVEAGLTCILRITRKYTLVVSIVAFFVRI